MGGTPAKKAATSAQMNCQSLSSRIATKADSSMLLCAGDTAFST
jgi:hypothetical protein